MDTLNSPGDPCLASGIYEIVNRDGSRYQGEERTVVKFEPFPPTPVPGKKYKLVQLTRH